MCHICVKARLYSSSTIFNINLLVIGRMMPLPRHTHVAWYRAIELWLLGPLSSLDCSLLFLPMSCHVNITAA